MSLTNLEIVTYSMSDFYIGFYLPQLEELRARHGIASDEVSSLRIALREAEQASISESARNP